MSEPATNKHRNQARSAVAIITVGLALLGGTMLGRAGAQVTVACEELILAGGGTFGGMSTNAEWELGDWSGNAEVADGTIDLDGDGISDVTMGGNLQSGWLLGTTGGGTEAWENGAYGAFAAGGYANDILVERGIDYSTLGSIVASDTDGDGDIDEDDQPDGAATYLEVLLKKSDPNGTDWPAGIITFTVTLTFVNEAEETTESDVVITFDTSGADLSGSTTATSAWPPGGLSVSVFADSFYYDTVATSTQTYGGTIASPVLEPWSDVSTRVDYGEGNSIGIGYLGALADDGFGTLTAVGAPGDAGLAVVTECDAALPAYWAALGHDNTVTTLSPGRVQASGSILGAGDLDGDGDLDVDGDRTFYLDLGIDRAPDALEVSVEEVDVDVDGDGTPDGSDTDGDGINDRGSWLRAALTHTASGGNPSFDGVIATRSPDGAGEDLYLAMAAAGIPPNVAVDMAGPTTWDGIQFDREVATSELAFCDKSATTYPSTCTTPPVSAGPLTFRYADEIPSASADATLPAIFGSFDAPPADLADPGQIAGRFDPRAPHWVSAEVVGTEDGGSAGDVAYDVREVAGVVDGLQRVTYDGSSLDELRVDVESTGMQVFGLDVDYTDTTSGDPTSLWSVLADLPGSLSLALDPRPETIDGDPIELRWAMTGTTGAAVSVDTERAAAQNQQTHLSAWIGRGVGTTDGIRGNGKILVDLEGSEQGVSYSTPAMATAADTTVEVGLQTSTELQRTAGLARRGHFGAQVPERLAVNWTIDDENLADLEVQTCTGRSCPVNSLFATITNDAWPVGQPDDISLLGVPMVPVPASAGVFPDFTGGALPQDYTNLVFRGDPASGSPPGLAGDETNTWGVDLRLAELSAAQYARETSSSWGYDAFVRTDMCLTARTATPDFGIGIYADTGPDTPARWTSAMYERLTGNDLMLTAQLNTPATDSGGVIGDLTWQQLALAEASPDDYDLIDVRNADCDGFEYQGDRQLAGQMRIGTADDVGNILEMGSFNVDSAGNPTVGIPVPAAEGLDATFQSADYGNGEKRQGLDAAFRWLLPDELSVRQPLFLKCGGGNQDPSSCQDAPAFSAETTTQIVFETSADEPGDLGDLDLEYLTEPLDPQDTDDDGDDDRNADGLAIRSLLRADRLPLNLTVEMDVRERERDRALEGDLTLIDAGGDDLGDIAIEYRNDYAPARLGDESEAAATNVLNENQALIDLEINDIGPSLDISLDVSAPTYGWTPQAYGDADCEGWSTPSNLDRIYPSDPAATTNWDTETPRAESERRPQYLRGEIYLAKAPTLDISVDARVDEYGDYADDYDKGPRTTSKLAYQASGDTSGDLWLLYPGLVNGTDAGRFETCFDVDVPLHINWSDATRISVGLDQVKATVTMLEDELAAGANATIAVEEQIFDGAGAPTAAVGIWASQSATYLNSGYDYISLFEDERMSVGMVDPGDEGAFLTAGAQNAVSVQADFRGGSWLAQGVDADGDEYHGAVLLDLFFAPSVEAEMVGNTAWNVLWNGSWLLGVDGLDETTDYVLDASCSTCGGETSEPSSRFTLPEADWAASSADAYSGTYNTARQCVGEASDSFGPFGLLDDGTYFEFKARWGGSGRLQLYFVGFYDNGEVRFVRELYDFDSGGGARCYQWQFDYELTTDDTGRIQLDLDIESGLERAGDVWWKTVSSARSIFDASGNGGAVFADGGDFLTPSSPTVAIGETVELTSTFDPSASHFNECVWLAGDGTQIEDDTATYSYSYAFPGEYQVLQLCYNPWVGGSGDDLFNVNVAETTIAVTD